ncbi:hypothetical protein CG740_35760 [Streptomyces sp. CB01201]|nr:hypothetical protein CG740_35760 [Streptomyces sp. CB01201]
MAKSAFVTGLRVVVAVAGLLHVALGLLTLRRLPGPASRAGVSGPPGHLARTRRPPRRRVHGCRRGREHGGPDVQTRPAGSRPC